MLGSKAGKGKGVCNTCNSRLLQLLCALMLYQSLLHHYTVSVKLLEIIWITVIRKHSISWPRFYRSYETRITKYQLSSILWKNHQKNIWFWNLLFFDSSKLTRAYFFERRAAMTSRGRPSDRCEAADRRKDGLPVHRNQPSGLDPRQ